MLQLKVRIEHWVKHFGLFTGILMTGVLGSLCILLDFLFACPFHLEAFNRLVGVGNILLSVIIGILLTSFSVIFVVMQLASSQFSPRILRYFLYNDLTVQQFIGLCVGTIGLLLLPQVFYAFFPQQSFLISMSVALAFSFFCLLILFPYLITYLSNNMNVATIANRIKTEITGEIHGLYTANWKPGDPLLYKREKRDSTRDCVRIVCAEPSGYLDSVNYPELSRLYKQFLKENPDLPPSRVYQKPIVGEFILHQTTILLTVDFDKPVSTQQEAMVLREFTKIATDVFSINKYRSYTQDINFGVRKLVDISIKAISPAVNDPTTCLNCLDYIGEIVRELSVKKFPTTASQSLLQENIYINEFGFDEFVDFCFDQIYHWGKKDPVVVRRIIQTIRQILPHVENPYHLMILIRELDELEIEKIYKTPPDPTLELEFRAEQITTIQKDLAKFRAIAKQQIAKLPATGDVVENAHTGAVNPYLWLRQWAQIHEKP